MFDWIKVLADHAKPNLSPRGFERYSGIMRQHLIPDMGSIMLTALRPEHLQKHYTAKLNNGLSARTVRYHHAIIHKALKEKPSDVRGFLFVIPKTQIYDIRI